jgi:hypothetical protein
MYSIGSIVGWLTSIGPDGEALVVPKDRLGNLTRDLILMPRLN